MDGRFSRSLVRWKLCTRSSGALRVFSPGEHERSLRAARQRIAVSIGETCIFHDCSNLGLLSSHVCPRRSLCRLLSRVTHALLVFVFSLSKWKHNAFVEGNASFDSEVTLSASCRCRVAGKLVCQPSQSDAGHSSVRKTRALLPPMCPSV